MSGAFRKVGVDRNTVVVNAPIAELYIAVPDQYKEVLKIPQNWVNLRHTVRLQL